MSDEHQDQPTEDNDPQSSGDVESDISSQPDESDGDTNPNHEAARYRVKLREVEAERDHLATQLDAIRKSQIDTTVVAMGLKPQALWASGVQLDALLDEQGVPDEQKITAAADNARKQLGINKPPRPFGGLKSGSAVPHERRDSWAAAFSPRER